MWLVQSGYRNVWDNLALEEVLFQDAASARGFLLFYTNRPAVVMGRNQNPWRECRVEGLKNRGIALARRISGGGTVYHDEGNLNYGLILPRGLYQRERCFAWILASLHACGIPAVRQGSTSLGVGKHKISGSSFAYRGDAVLHHGTLLLHAHLDRLHRALQLPEVSISDHAVLSDPAPVKNLLDIQPRLTAEALISVLSKTLSTHINVGPIHPLEVSRIDNRRWLPLAKRHRRVQWKFGRISPFRVSLKKQDGPAIQIDVTNDRVSRAVLFARPGAEFRCDTLSGLRFRPRRLAGRLRSDSAVPCQERKGAATLLSTTWS